MKLLLDTHALIWFAEDDARLTPTALQAIENQENEVFVSIASFWEMAIKVSIGKLQLQKPLPELTILLIEHNFQIQSIQLEHTLIVKTLPFYHRDPFDRMLIAQGLGEQMILVSNEVIFDAYGVTRIW